MKFCLVYPLVTFPHSQPLVWDVGGPETVLYRWEIGTRAVLIFDLLLQNPSSGEWIQGACARMGLDTRQEYHIIRGEVSMSKCQLLRHLCGSPTLSGPQFVEDTVATVPERMLLKITLASLQHLKFQSPFLESFPYYPPLSLRRTAIEQQHLPAPVWEGLSRLCMQGRCYDPSYFRREETEAERSLVTFSKPSIWYMVMWKENQVSIYSLCSFAKIVLGSHLVRLRA